MSVATALSGLVRHPVRFLRTRWNWKAALASALMRGSIFFGTTIEFGFAVAARTLIVDAAFRLPLAGTCAGVVQELRNTQPRWGALTVAIVAVPAGAHLIEIAAHATAGTPRLWRGVALSCGLSAASSGVEWLLMGHDIMLVGPGGHSLAGDVAGLVNVMRRGRR
jgi:hypothetical protein